MRKALILIFCGFSSFCFGEASWINEVQNRIDEDAVTWLRNELSKSIEDSQRDDLGKLVGDQCKTCFSGRPLEGDPNILVFMSFSVPAESWIQLSKELEKQGGIFVVRGIPENSFQVYAKSS